MTSKAPKFNAPERIYLRLGKHDRSDVMSYSDPDGWSFPGVPDHPINVYTDRKSCRSACYIGFDLLPSTGVFKKYKSTGELFFVDFDRHESEYQEDYTIKIRSNELEAVINGSSETAEVRYEAKTSTGSYQELRRQLIVVDPSAADSWLAFDMSAERRAAFRDCLLGFEAGVLEEATQKISAFLTRNMSLEEKRALVIDMARPERLDQLKHALGSSDPEALKALNTSHWDLRSMIDSIEGVGRRINYKNWPK